MTVQYFSSADVPNGGFGTATAAASFLRDTNASFTTLPTPPACPGDFNGDGALNSQDFFDFLTAFFGTAPSADFNRDGAVNSQDFFDFLTAFFAGC
jgi:hypothetical protein